MDEKDKEILRQFLFGLVRDIKSNMRDAGQVATGATSKAIRVELERSTGTIFAPAHIGALEDGRRPTGSGATKGNVSLVDRIKEWIEAKGLDLNPYAVAHKIHKEGTRLFRAGGQSGVLTNVITPSRIEALKNSFAEKFRDEVITEVKSVLTNR